MATPIKNTPSISGRDSKKFNKNFNKTKDNTLSTERLLEMENFVKQVEIRIN